eukprot:6214626-Pleurochrysis_carterae.AAC.2
MQTSRRARTTAPTRMHAPTQTRATMHCTRTSSRRFTCRNVPRTHETGRTHSPTHPRPHTRAHRRARTRTNKFDSGDAARLVGGAHMARARANAAAQTTRGMLQSAPSAFDLITTGERRDSRRGKGCEREGRRRGVKGSCEGEV